MTTLAVLSTEMRANTAQHDRSILKSSSTVSAYGKNAKTATRQNSAMGDAFSNVANKVAILQGPLGGVSGRLSALASGFNAVGVAGVGIGVLLTGLTATMASSLRVFSQYEQSQLKLEGLLKATGNASGLTGEQLDKMARSVARNTLASTEGVKSAQAVLLTFKTVQGEAFNRAIALSQDLAAVMGGDIKSAALQLGKALEDPTTGLTALKRSGVSFTESERELIKSLNETGRAAEAQGLILEKLAAQVGGAGAAEGAGLAGAVDLLTQEYDEFLEAIGKSGTGAAATTLLNTLANGIRNVKDELFPDAELQFNDLLRERVEIERELQDIRDNGTGLVRLLTGNSAPNLEAEKQQINDQLRALQEKREEQIKAQAAAQESAKAAADLAEQDRQVTEEKRKQKEVMEEQVKVQRQLLKETEARTQKKDSLYQKLFGGQEDNRRVLDNTAFNNAAKAASVASKDGRGDDFKRLIEQMTLQLDASKNSSFRYDLEGMQDVINLLRKQGGEKKEKMGTIEIIVGDKKPVEVSGNSKDLSRFAKDLAAVLNNESASVGLTA